MEEAGSAKAWLAPSSARDATTCSTRLPPTPTSGVETPCFVQKNPCPSNELIETSSPGSTVAVYTPVRPSSQYRSERRGERFVNRKATFVIGASSSPFTPTAISSAPTALSSAAQSSATDSCPISSQDL